MTNAETELRQLDAAFNRSKTMTPAVFAAKRLAILEREPDDAAHTANATAENDEKFVTLGALKKSMSKVAQGVIKVVFSPISKRVSSLEANVADGLASTARVLQPIIERLATIDSKLATVETRCAALSMMIAKSPEARTTVSDLESLIDRVKSLETRPVMEYRGVWKSDDNYRPGDLVTHAGSMHYCWSPTKGKPGECKDWQMCVKKGKDSAR